MKRALLLATASVAAHLVLLAVLPRDGQLVESLYGRTVYPAMLRLWGWIPAQVPFSAATLLATALITWLLLATARRWFRAGPGRALALGLRDGYLLAVCLFHLFFLTWGYNYYRVPLAARLGLRPPPPARLEEAVRELLARLPPRPAFPRSWDTAELDRLLSRALRAAARRVGLAELPASPPVKPVHPSGLLAASGTLGIVIPWTLEAHVEPDLPPPWLAVVAAHEKAHLCGIAREGEAGFFAWLALTESGDPRLRYAGFLGLLGAMAARRPELRRAAPPALLADVAALESFRAQYVMPLWRRITRRLYDTYLKANRVPGGISDYGEALRLAAAWWLRQSKRLSDR